MRRAFIREKSDSATDLLSVRRQLCCSYRADRREETVRPVTTAIQDLYDGRRGMEQR